MSISIKEQIDAYIAGINHKFKADEVYKFVKQRLNDEIPQLDIRIDNFLDESRYLFYNEDKDYYIPRSIYFMDSKFLASPTAEEIMSGVLIPGHRFVPFCNLDNFPGDSTLLLPDGNEVPKKKIRKKVDELFIYLSLLDLYTLPDYMIYDDESNRELFEQDNIEKNTAIITVYDLAEFYETHNFRLGDALLLEVKDWNKGVYQIEYSPAGMRTNKQKEITKWIKLLDESFDNLFIDEGIRTKIDEQIAVAFYNAGKFLIENPYIHLGGYLDESELVKIIALGEKHVLWYKDEEPGPEDFIHLGEMTGTFESLDDILMDINSPVSANEVEAFMRNEFFCRTNNYDNVLKNCFGDIELTFFDEYQEKKCFEFITELWAAVKKEYNFFTDQIRGTIRKRALEILKFFNSRFNEIEKKFSSVQEPIQAEDIMEVTNILNNLFSVLGFCNEESRIVDNEAEHLNEVLDSIDSEVKYLVESIEKKLKPKLSLVKKRKKANKDCKEVYILNITLIDIEPPVWRKIRVPGKITLGELHPIIQCAFGWQDCHLHDFKIEKVVYGVPDNEDGPEMVNEADVTLSSVLKNEKQKFVYTYDYGDDWAHMVLVEKILPMAEASIPDREQVLCLAGERACPPEDCGGALEYEEMLVAIKDKKHPQYREYKDWLDKDFDPEYFNLDEINARLAGKCPW